MVYPSITHCLHRHIAAKVLAGKQSYTTRINSIIIIMASNASHDSQTNTLILSTAHFNPTVPTNL